MQSLAKHFAQCSLYPHWAGVLLHSKHSRRGIVRLCPECNKTPAQSGYSENCVQRCLSLHASRTKSNIYIYMIYIKVVEWNLRRSQRDASIYTHKCKLPVRTSRPNHITKSAPWHAERRRTRNEIRTQLPGPNRLPWHLHIWWIYSLSMPVTHVL